MEAKLKSTLNRIPWSLLLKACILSLSWLILPFWMFLVVAFYFYFIPFFQSFKLIIPFILTMLASAIIPYGFWSAVFLGVLFFFLLGIKNLIFVDRFDNHQTMVFLILFLIFFGFFRHFPNWEKWTASLISLGSGLSFFFLLGELADYIKGMNRSKKLFIAGIGSFLVWQAALVILFLPLNYFYQTALLFLSSAILMDIFLVYLGKKMNRTKILADFSIFFVIVVIILASANWGL